MRHVSAVVGALLVLAVGANPAIAHPSVSPKQVPSGETTRVRVNLTHGCGDEALDPFEDPIDESLTTRIVLAVADDVEIEAEDIDGWSVTHEAAERRVVWTSEDPEGVAGSVQLPLEVQVLDLPAGADIWLPLVQGCANGMAVSWTHPGTTRGGDEMPAMRLVVAGDADSEPAQHADSVDMRRYGLPIVVALAGLALAMLSRWARSRPRSAA